MATENDQADPDQGMVREYYDQHVTTAAGGMGDHVPAVAWVIRGMTGGINLLAGVIEHGGSIPAGWLSILEREHARLGKLVEHARKVQ